MPVILNWREIKTLSERFQSLLRGATVQKVLIRKRSITKEGFLKNEWCLRLEHPENGAFHLILNLNPQHPFFSLSEGFGPKPNSQASDSSFGLVLQKELPGSRLDSLDAISGERILRLKLSNTSSHSSLFLFICFIPSAAEAILTQTEPTREGAWSVIARSKNSKQNEKLYHLPKKQVAPPELTIREEIQTPELKSFAQVVEQSLRSHYLELRKKHLLQKTKEKNNRDAKLKKKLLKSQSFAQGESDWKLYGDLILANLHLNISIDRKKSQSSVTLPHYESGEPVEIAIDEKLSLSDQAQKFFQKEKRKKRKLSELKDQLSQIEENLEKLKKEKAQIESIASISEIEKFEESYFQTKKDSSSQKLQNWTGKLFYSQEKLPILVGRSFEQNNQLTFQIARGHDIWLHVKNQPGVHCIIKLPRGKTASLETLLDAACLTLYYTLGRTQEKREVDYTLRKNVRKIKGSKKVTYVGEKTLFLDTEEKRLKRLLG